MGFVKEDIKLAGFIATLRQHGLVVVSPRSESGVSISLRLLSASKLYDGWSVCEEWWTWLHSLAQSASGSCAARITHLTGVPVSLAIDLFYFSTSLSAYNLKLWNRKTGLLPSFR
jgi:hypothetical protein